MNLPDLVNGGFEAFGAVALAGNVRQLRRDREVKGVDWRTTVFFTSWGLWNLFYYPHLGQWLSFAGGVAICCINLIWLGLLLRFSRGSMLNKYHQALLTCGFRYRDMQLAQKADPTDALYSFTLEFIDGCHLAMPIHKLCRWLGYIQGVLIERGYTTVTAERDWTRPLFRPLDFPTDTGV